MYVWIYENGLKEIVLYSDVFFFPETSKVDDVKIKRNVSFLLSSTLFLFSLFSLFLSVFFAWSDFKAFRSCEIKMRMGDLLQSIAGHGFSSIQWYA